MYLFRKQIANTLLIFDLRRKGDCGHNLYVTDHALLELVDSMVQINNNYIK